MKPTSASAARKVPQAGYPDGDVEVRRDGDMPGVLSSVLGIRLDGDPGDGGQRAVVAAGEGTAAAA